VTVSTSGLLTCAGGKWTTYRQMAEDAVDEAIKTFNLTPKCITLSDISGVGRAGFTTNGTCVTRSTPILGSHGWSTHLPAQLTEVYGIDADIAHHLATNYGDRAWSVLSDASGPDAGTARLSPSFPFIEAEIRHAVRSEAACTTADVIARRTRLAFLDVDAALNALPRVIDIMAEELDWSEARREKEWARTVRFLRSMGLDDARLGVTREEVMSGKAKARRMKNDGVARPPGPVASKVRGGREMGWATVL